MEKVQTLSQFLEEQKQEVGEGNLDMSEIQLIVSLEKSLTPKSRSKSKKKTESKKSSKKPSATPAPEDDDQPPPKSKSSKKKSSSKSKQKSKPPSEKSSVKHDETIPQSDEGFNKDAKSRQEKSFQFPLLGNSILSSNKSRLNITSQGGSKHAYLPLVSENESRGRSK